MSIIINIIDADLLLYALCHLCTLCSLIHISPCFLLHNKVKKMICEEQC